MNSIQTACLLLVVSPATSTWTKKEMFKAAGCAASDKIEVAYDWIGDCGPMNDKFSKTVCGSSKNTKTTYTDSACTIADTTATPTETVLTCTKSPYWERWETITCDAAPASFSAYNKYSTNACATVVSSGKFATGICILAQTSSGAGNATTWAAGSTMHSVEGTQSSTTGLKKKTYTTDDCTGASTDEESGTQCSGKGNKFTSITTGAAATASDADNIRVFSPVVGIFCTAAVLTYF